MATQRDHVEPRTYFLNERHQLSTGEKEGGGRIPDYVNIPWARKGRDISQSIERVIEQVSSSRDPLRDRRYFVLARPVAEVEKRSKDSRKAPQGTFLEPTDFGSAQGKVFDRLGLDLLGVSLDGRALVHANVETVQQLRDRSLALDSLGAREQARWATIDAFDLIPVELRVDGDWLGALSASRPSDVVFELQPVLGRAEADQVLRAIAELLSTNAGEALVATGTDFSGRHWFRGRATQASVRSVAREFFSVQSIHTPLLSVAYATRRARTAARRADMQADEVVDLLSLPCVAVVDMGVALDHRILSRYRRGRFVPQGVSPNPIGDHGSFVASRVVFGECNSADELAEAPGSCSFYDVLVGDGMQGSSGQVNDKVVLTAMAGVAGSAPDVRVFNLSFGDVRPLSAVAEVEQREKRLLLRDLDNYIFANDVIVVVAAGNSARGVIPDQPYPTHVDDPRWALGAWACGFNTLVCGSHVARLSTGGLVGTVGWPSAFTRIGPGICDAPIPSFCEHGGNSDESYNAGNGMGVWGYSDAGDAEDRIGTSFAAPLLAREAAITLSMLQSFCAEGSRPYGVAVRAFLSLTAVKTTVDIEVKTLADRALGLGKASASRLIAPFAGSAVLLWQGVIESPRDVVRVQLPIPSDWLGQADDPILRLCIAYDPPVNDAATALWACRRVRAVLRPGPDAVALKSQSGGHVSFPLISREYRLRRYGPGAERDPRSSLWIIELSYEEVFSYIPGMEFDPLQRIAFAAELIDVGASKADPHAHVQALPISPIMNRLAIQPAHIRNAIAVRVRS